MAPVPAELKLVPTPEHVEFLHCRMKNLERHPEFHSRYKERLESCELGFFAYNASLYNGPKERDEFHESFLEFRCGVRSSKERSLMELRLRRAVFDHVSTHVPSSPGSCKPM